MLSLLLAILGHVAKHLLLVFLGLLELLLVHGLHHLAEEQHEPDHPNQRVLEVLGRVEGNPILEVVQTAIRFQDQRVHQSQVLSVFDREQVGLDELASCVRLITDLHNDGLEVVTRVKNLKLVRGWELRDSYRELSINVDKALVFTVV